MKGTVWIIAVCLWTGGTALDAERNPETDRKEIVELEQEWLQQSSNRAVLRRILADDFRHPVPEGLFLTKRQHINWMTRHPRPPERIAAFESLEVRLYGDTAVANGIVAETDANGGNPRRSVFTDVFACRDGRWQAVNAQENAVVSDAAGGR
ncbi:MAG: nuclear transport factor 2 family protein [Bryobacteraceae bacterium]